jgi:hypothetical protein
MVDLVITAANVTQQVGGQTGEKIAGASITAGQALTVDSSGQAILASDASLALAQVIGIALQNAAAGQPIKYQITGRINVGATLDVGKLYVLSTSGAIAPCDDIEIGDFPTFLGIAEDADVLRLNILSAPAAAASAVT